jgi:hypothetical protein
MRSLDVICVCLLSWSNNRSLPITIAAIPHNLTYTRVIIFPPLLPAHPAPVCRPRAVVTKQLIFGVTRSEFAGIADGVMKPYAPLIRIASRLLRRSNGWPSGGRRIFFR